MNRRKTLSKSKVTGKVIIISGPSGSGKTTLFERCLKCKDIKKRLAKTVSYTTRHIRQGEKDGRDYFFVSRKMFLYKKHAGHFLEHEQVFDNYYGTSHKQVKELLKAGKHVVLLIDVKGAAVVRKKCESVVSIFIKPPNMTILKKRLMGRGSESKEIVNKRLSVARLEMQKAKDYDFCLVNENLQESTQKLQALILSIMTTAVK